MRRVLMVLYYFPPLGGIGSLRGLKFASYLPEFGWDPFVLAPRNGAYYRDSSLTFPPEKVARSYSLEISRLGKRLLRAPEGDTQPARVGPATRLLQGAVRRWVYKTDGQVGWYPFAVHSGRAVLRDAHFHAIFSSSFPVTSHLIARRLHREFDLPWVAEFRDPWADALPVRDPRKQWAERTEREIVSEADAIVVPSPEWADLFRSKGAREVEVITNGCDPSDLPAPEPVRGFVLSHLGSLMPERQDFSSVFAALAGLVSARTFPDVRLRFIGDLPAAVRAEIGRRGLEGCLEVTGFQPYRRALSLMNASSALLVAGARNEDPLLRGWVPAKVFEYLATGLPILYVGDPRTDVAGLLSRQAGCFLVPPGDLESARRALVAAAATPRAVRDLSGFTRRDLAGRLAAVLGRVA